MDCNKANKLILKFMENSITEEEYISLENHLENCKECEDDFSLYTSVLDDFEQNINIMEAPSDFTQNVMKKIEHIKPDYIDNKKSTNIFYYTISLFSALLIGIVIFVNFYKDDIVKNFPADSFIYKFFEFNQNLIYNNNLLLSDKQNLPNFILYLRIAFLFIVLILIIGQYNIYKKNKIQA